MSDEKERTERGFRVYARVPDSRGGTVRVQESSEAGTGAHVWLFYDDVECWEHLGKHHRPELHLTVAQARRLCVALATFVAEAEMGELTEPAAEEDSSNE